MAVIPVYNILALPDTDVYLRTETFEKAAGRPPKTDESIILLVLKKDAAPEEIDDESFYPIGVTGQVAEIRPEGWFVVRTGDRVNINELSVFPDGRIEIVTSRRKDTDVLDPQEDARKAARVK